MTTLHNGAVLALACLLFIGCAASTDPGEVGEISSALELEAGGLDMDDELPMFADSLVESLELPGAVDVAIDDPMELDAEVVSLRASVDAVQYRLAVLWGQIPGDPEAATPHDWSGAFVVNRGAILARRTIRFEGRTDGLLPRNNPQVLAFRSATLPHNDGMILTIIDPNPAAADPMVLTYVADLPGPAGSEGGILRVPVAALLDGPEELASDADGNRMVAVAQARPVDVCQNGFLMGHWHKIDEDRGRFRGRVVSEDGELRGHIRGIYGQRIDGSRVFFGKYINTDGEFRGIFRGEYGAGHFRGRWISRAGEVGALGGQYRESIPGPETGGHFMGRWAETSCNLHLP